MRRRTVIVVGVVAVVVAVVWAAVVVARRRAEGFEWAPRGEGVEVVDDGHRKLIEAWCASGKPMSELRRSRYDFLAKYTKNAVRAVCMPERKTWRAGARNLDKSTFYRSNVVDARCWGGRVCGKAAIRVTHPCESKAGDMCCLYKEDSTKGGKNCVAKRGGLDYDTARAQVVPS